MYGRAPEIATNREFQPVLILGCNRGTTSSGFFPDAPIVWTVERDGVPLTIVKLLAALQPSVP